MEAPRKDHLIGTQVGEYIIEERIGIGGMGVVYRASQPKIGKQVAIKVLRAEVMEDPREMERFLDEARSVNAISHRGIISIFGSGELADGRMYLVMEYLKGEGLDAKLKREGRMAASDVIPILEEITSALQGVHNAGIVHRDLKPGNVFLVEQDDGRPWVKLLDFGLARRGERTDVSRIAGTPDYLSPEHSRGLAAGPPSDLYSLGVMTFQLLTGQLPFTGRTPLEVMEKHVYSEPPNAVALEPSIPDALNQLLASLLRKEPNARPQIQQIKAQLKQAAKQVRAASTQPGDQLPAADVAAARERAENYAQSAPTPMPGDAAPVGKATDQAVPLFEGLPRALAQARTSDSGPLSTPSPAVSPVELKARAEAAARSEKKTTRLVFMGLGALAAVLVAALGWSHFSTPSEVPDTGVGVVRPNALGSKTTRGTVEIVPMPNVRAATPTPRPDDEEAMPENPAASPQLPDGGY